MRLFSAIMSPSWGQRTSEIRVGQDLLVTCSAPLILQGRHRNPKRAQPAKVRDSTSAQMPQPGPFSFATQPLSQKGSLTEKSSSENWEGHSFPLASILGGVLGAVLLFLSRQFNSTSKLMSCRAALVNSYEAHVSAQCWVTVVVSHLQMLSSLG